MPRQRRSRLGIRRGAVVEEDDAVGEGFGGEELEADGAMARRAGLKPRPYNRQRREQRCKRSGDGTRDTFKLRLRLVGQKPHSLKAVPLGRDGEVNSPLQRTRARKECKRYEENREESS